MNNVKIGLSQWSQKAPAVICKVGDTLYAIGTAMGGYSLAQGQPWAIKVGAGCLIAGIALERLSGCKSDKKADNQQQ